MTLYDVLRSLVRGDSALNDPAWQAEAQAAIGEHEAASLPAAATARPPQPADPMLQQQVPANTSPGTAADVLAKEAQ